MSKETRGSRGIRLCLSLALLAGGLAAASASVPAWALEQAANEREALKACEKRICDILVHKSAAGEDLSCSLSKTWAQSSLRAGIEKRKLSWLFGDARCSVELSARRDLVLGAVTKPEHALELPPHTVKCELERDREITTVDITMAPRISFRNGVAEKAWLNIRAIEAPSVVKGVLWTVAQIEDSFGVFHGDLIAEINRFVQKSCPKAVAAH